MVQCGKRMSKVLMLQAYPGETLIVVDDGPLYTSASNVKDWSPLPEEVLPG